MKKYFLRVCITSLLFSIFSSILARAQDTTKISKLLNDVTYGVPSSPAFELLPNKPSEITHLGTPSDITAHISDFIDGGKLKAGAAFDIRPFAYAVGNLDQYQDKKNWFKRILWRTVFSAGTASESTTNSDVFIGLGLRIPLIDGGDPRSDAVYTKTLDDAYLAGINKLQPDLDEPAVAFQNRLDKLKDQDNIKKIRAAFINKSFNAWRWDIGVGASERAASGFLKTDSLFADRIGLWTAASKGFGGVFQITVSANTAWAKAASDTNENHRSVAGARLKCFIDENWSISGEYAKIYSNYANHALNENWNHLAIVLEVKDPLLKGWVGLGYGGDSSHRSDPSSKFTFNYAFYTDRIIKKN